MGIVKNGGRVTKKSSRLRVKRKFEAKFEARRFVIVGRSAFSSVAKKIAVNQNRSKGHVEDRRHILHYDEVLKPAIERVITNMYVSEGMDKQRVARAIRARLIKRGIRRLPRTPDKLFERLVTEINSAPDNLIPDRADTNKAIEVVRGYVRTYITKLSTHEFASDCLGNNFKRMDKYKLLAREVLVRDSTGGDITSERNRIHGEILQFVDGCRSPGQLWTLLHEIVHSVTFDFSPKSTRDATVKAIAWQHKMSLNEERPPLDQLDDLLSLLD